VAVLAADADPVIAIRAYRAALTAGDIALAKRAAAILRGAGVAPGDAALLPIADAARAGDAAALQRALASLGDTPLVLLTPSLSAWARFAAGQGIADLPAQGLDPVARRLLGETRALLLIASGKPDDGLAAITALAGAARPPVDLRIAAAQLLFTTDRAESARTLLAGEDPVLARLREGAPARATLGFGLSRLLARVAADLQQAETVPLRIALTRAALAADPDYGRARLLLAASLAEADEADLALAELAAVPAASPWGGAARAAGATVLAEAGRPDQALAAARDQATASGSNAAAWESYADLLSQAGRHEEAARWYRRLVDGPDAREWGSWARLANALEAAGQWPAARAALARTVELAPDEPLALNNAGYARLSHGEAREGTRLLERAARLAPDDTSIADSLGWAYHLSGQTGRALPLIERAAQDQPTNAEIADHLGDVYWTLGRRYEARYSWAAAKLVATPGQAPALAAKIDRGLPSAR
jgi:Flp pilus assembly protein TadD